MDWYAFLADFVDKFGPTIVGLLAVAVAYLTTSAQLRKQEALAERQLSSQAQQEDRRYKRRLYVDLVSTATAFIRDTEREQKVATMNLVSETRLSLRGNEPARAYLDAVRSVLLDVSSSSPARVRSRAISALSGLTTILADDMDGAHTSDARIAELREPWALET